MCLLGGDLCSGSSILFLVSVSWPEGTNVPIYKGTLVYSALQRAAGFIVYNGWPSGVQLLLSRALVCFTRGRKKKSTPRLLLFTIQHPLQLIYGHLESDFTGSNVPQMFHLCLQRKNEHHYISDSFPSQPQPEQRTFGHNWRRVYLFTYLLFMHVYLRDLLWESADKMQTLIC